MASGVWYATFRMPRIPGWGLCCEGGRGGWRLWSEREGGRRELRRRARNLQQIEKRAALAVRKRQALTSR